MEVFKKEKRIDKVRNTVAGAKPGDVNQRLPWVLYGL